MQGEVVFLSIKGYVIIYNIITGHQLEKNRATKTKYLQHNALAQLKI